MAATGRPEIYFSGGLGYDLCVRSGPTACRQHAMQASPIIRQRPMRLWTDCVARLSGLRDHRQRFILRGLGGLFVLALAATTAKAQYRFDSWTTDNGLPQAS